MLSITTSAILALAAIKACSASAPVPPLKPRQAANPIAQFYFEGAFVSVGQYADYSIAVPEDGSTVAITNPKVVYSIIPDDTLSDCTFTGADGTQIGITGYQQDIIPQPLISVTCAARTGSVVTPTGFPNFTSFFPTIYTALPTTSIIPFRPTGTGTVGTVGTSAPSTGFGSSGVVPPYPTGTGYYVKRSHVRKAA